jgi:predicted TIM-barrel fold metal-dependent hydrolase
VPWVDRAPVEIVRDHIRLTLQPFDAPPSAADVERLLEHLGSDDMLLFSSDYPHWHFDGDDVLPDGLPDAVLGRILISNPTATYARMGGAA